MDANKIAICRSGGLDPIVRGIRDGVVLTARMAITALANIAEVPENLDRIVDTNAILFLVAALGEPHIDIKRESARALGNLAVNIEFGDMILREGALGHLIPMLRSADSATQRMGAFCLCSKYNTYVQISHFVFCTLDAYQKCIICLLYQIMSIFYHFYYQHQKKRSSNSCNMTSQNSIFQ